jgi:uncharacterized protein (DUF2147 family)
MTIKSALITFALASFAVGGVANAAEPYGTWTRPSTGTQVSFYNCGGKLCGKIVAVKDQARKNTVGTVIMKGRRNPATAPGRATCSTSNPARPIPAS